MNIQIDINASKRKITWPYSTKDEELDYAFDVHCPAAKSLDALVNPLMRAAPAATAGHSQPNDLVGTNGGGIRITPNGFYIWPRVAILINY